MQEEVVERRKWLSRQYFLDLMGATNLIPGPNSTEMAIHIGYVRAGLAGLVVAGASFILPAALTTSVLAWTYVEYGQTPRLAPVLDGIKPAVMAIIVTAGWRFTTKAVRGWSQAAIVSAVACASLARMGPIQSLLAGAMAGTLWLLWIGRRRPQDGPPQQPTCAAALLGVSGTSLVRGPWTGPGAALLAAVAPAAPTLLSLGLFFLKVGFLLYGTGYVLLAYLDGGLVHQYGWLTRDQLVEAVAIGQVTPGPLLSTATFIGYVVMAKQGRHASGLAGGLVATICVFLPSFLLVALTNPLIPKLRQSRIAATFLDAVNAASLGLMVAVAIPLGAAIFFHGAERVTLSWRSVDWRSVGLALVAAAAMWRWKVRPAWIVIAGAVAGGLLSLSD
jgi:chromate transporter